MSECVHPKCVCGAQPIPASLSMIELPNGFVVGVVSCGLCGTIVPAVYIGVRPKVVSVNEKEKLQ